MSVQHPIIYTGFKTYPNVPLNQYEVPFCLQCMNGIQVVKPAGQKCNPLLDAVVTILKYKKAELIMSDKSRSYLK